MTEEHTSMRISQRHLTRSALDIDRRKSVILTVPSDPRLRLGPEHKVGSGTTARRFRVWTYRFRGKDGRLRRIKPGEYPAVVQN
jgi:hypothetical protein